MFSKLSCVVILRTKCEEWVWPSGCPTQRGSRLHPWVLLLTPACCRCRHQHQMVTQVTGFLPHAWGTRMEFQLQDLAPRKPCLLWIYRCLHNEQVDEVCVSHALSRTETKKAEIASHELITACDEFGGINCFFLSLDMVRFQYRYERRNDKI